MRTGSKHIVFGFVFIYLLVVANLVVLQIENLHLSKKYLDHHVYDEAMFYLGQCLREASPISWITKECKSLVEANYQHAPEMRGYLEAADLAVWNYPEALLFKKRKLSEFVRPFDPNPYWAILVHLGFLSYLVLIGVQLRNSDTVSGSRRKWWLLMVFLSLIVWMISARLA